ncbi:GNAT family N-acetyltransferase [Amycolatopsis sp. OK19-0408]|uniref:GNAT family N-acetyltransferase n=1 Tax=Amycolatopsis iheyensis TaxID=2945988 RepID=A0A9X2SLG0_9PSEU|nr:GNAT family N-acetyltransferase [Amycolatopsis iheyensis]MCR6484841.1 GNAT family N-acetyltransferase [Amycolatopsis iheyensis]
MIRPAAVTDAGAIGEVHVRSWQAAYAGLIPADFLARLSAEARAASWARRIGDGGPVLVAEENGIVVGFAAYGPAQLFALYVLPEHWGRGVGRALHDRVVEDLSGDSAILWVLATNERAKAFYVRQGWVADGASQTETIDEGRVTLEELRFRRPLP